MDFSVSKGASDRRPDRGRHVRYPVSGSLVLHTGQRQYSGLPANLSLGGILFTADPVPPEGTEGTLKLIVVGFEETISTKVRIIRTHERAAAAVFRQSPAILARCVEWLAEKEALADKKSL